MCSTNYNTSNLDERNESRLKRNAAQKRYRAANKEKISAFNKAYREANRGKCLFLQKKWYDANQERIAAYRKAKYDANKEEEKAQSRRYYHAHKSWAAAKNKRWSTDNKDKTRVNVERRRSRKAGLPATLTSCEWEKILDDHFRRCHYCGIQSDNLHQEHKIPVSNGGGYTAENIVPACKSCNSSKGTRDYRKFVKSSKDRLQMELF